LVQIGYRTCGYVNLFGILKVFVSICKTNQIMPLKLYALERQFLRSEFCVCRRMRWVERKDLNCF
jgi:hypothetical protein